MSKINLKQIVLLALAGLVLVAVIIFIMLVGLENKPSLTVGLVLTGETDDDGWNSAHYNGVASACEKLDARLITKENIAEGSGDCAQVIHELVDEGAGMVILSSYSYSSEVKDIIDSYPEIAFYAISSEYTAQNCTSYFGRMYQARFLAGVIAGLQTETDSIGYVAAMSNSEVNRGINAFTMGVKSVNPDATVYVSWTGSWDNKEKEVEAAKSLILNQSADVLTYHQNQHYVARAADEMGVYSIGYNSVAQGLSDKYLTAAVWHWDFLYQRIIGEYSQGQPNSELRRWYGIDSEVVGLSELSPLVSEASRERLNEALNKLLGGGVVFSGEIYDNSGSLRCNHNETLRDEILFGSMDWLVEGVEVIQ